MPAQWTVLVYMAGDYPGLATQLATDQAAMQAATSSSDVDVIVEQVVDKGAMTRWQITQGSKTQLNNLDTGNPLTPPATGAQPVIVNTGLPGPLTDFITWGVQSFPASHVALVIWSHGSGVVYFNAIKAGLPAPPIGSGPLDVGYSQTFHSSLSTADLASALAAAPAGALDLVAFDACLMSMVEVGYQIRSSASFMLGSEVIVQGAALPYTKLLSDLVASPGMSPKDFALTAVADYSTIANAAVDGTLVAVDLGQLPTYAGAFQALVQAMSADTAAVTVARGNTTAIYPGYYLDSTLFMGQLATAFAAGAAASGAALQQAVLSMTKTGSGTTGYGGLSMFYPPGNLDVLPTYLKLDFPTSTGWGNLLQTLLGASAQAAAGQVVSGSVATTPSSLANLSS
jgi:hypothetical protein